MNCEFCYKIFGSKGNLLYHQRHSKSCLLIQNKEILCVMDFGCINYIDDELLKNSTTNINTNTPENFNFNQIILDKDIKINLLHQRINIQNYSHTDQFCKIND